MTDTKSRLKTDVTQLTADLLHGVVTYSGSELAQRKKDDWKESKEIVSRLYPRRRR